jgi:MarR family 2-MHQ and catechol resistance regulon transcriptional repressor
MAEFNPPPENVLRAWVVIRQTRDAVIRNLEQATADGDRSASTIMVLFALRQTEKPVSQRDLGRWLFRRGHSMSGLLDRMEKNGLIKRVRDEIDRRIVNVSITSEGRAVFDEAHPKVRAAITDIFSDLSDAELAQMTDLLWKVRTKAMKRTGTPQEVVDELLKPWEL